MEKISLKANSLYRTADSLDDAMNRAKALLFQCPPNEVHAAVMCYHNTLIKEMLNARQDTGGASQS